MRHWVLLMAFAPAMLLGQSFTRGVGVYPGDPDEYTGPFLEVDETYRNLALRRPAWHSSSYDYNLTAQLVTDGIKHQHEPQRIAVRTSHHGELPKQQREVLFDGNWVTSLQFQGKSGWIEIAVIDGEPPATDRLDIDASVTARRPDNQNWSFVLSASDDGRTWEPLGLVYGMARPSGEIHASILFSNACRARYYRLEFESGRELQWQIHELSFHFESEPVHLGGPHAFTSAWVPETAGEEWVYVDLGTSSEIDRIVLYWIRPAASAEVQISTDAKNWQTILPFGAGPAVQEVSLPQPARGRYVRLLLHQAVDPRGYALSELEVYGRGGLRPVSRPAMSWEGGSRLPLSRSPWKIERASEVTASGEQLSKPGFPDQGWLPATVPGTVLASYVHAGAVPEPGVADNILMISDAYFYADFWYRTEFDLPSRLPGQKLWLQFDGINWKAEVFLNGKRLGEIQGAFKRQRFDVTGLALSGGRNALAVRVLKVGHPGCVKEKTFEQPGKNGGVLGADNPTFHASIGWDWIPTIPGRETGIWNDVWLLATGPVTVEDPFVKTELPLPDTSSASVSIQVNLRNHSGGMARGVLRVRFGEARLEVPVELAPTSSQQVVLNPTTHPVLRIQQPRLWWPNGYGEPNLYPVELEFRLEDGTVSDSTAFQTGIRQFTYRVENDALKIWINGRRFIPRGGNWGFPEFLLRYRAREYDIAVRHHRQMNFTMIRNWVGQTGDEEFYEACDRHGIVVWQDFWLANPWDGPEPEDNARFLDNARDVVLRLRNHPSVGLYCGRNEGFPPKPLDEGLRQLIAELHPGLFYIPSSADDVVSGHGPYRVMPPGYYFERRATEKLHSEMGMPNVMNWESLTQTIPEEKLWPHGRLWGLHDFCLEGAQGARGFLDRIRKSYGEARNAREWVWLAQFVNYEGYRAMFEAQSRRRMGLLLWMSHPAWPSLVWQTYDYFFDPTAAYFAAQHSSEPLHIQWNPLTNRVEVVNYSAGHRAGLTAVAEWINTEGKVIWKREATLDSPEDSLREPIRLDFPAGLTPVHFLRLRLLERGAVISRNVYWRGLQPENFQTLQKLPPVNLDGSVEAHRDGSRWQLVVRLRNPAHSPALLVRLQVVRDRSQDRVLPVFWSDNYLILLPGETLQVTGELENKDCRGEAPVVVVDGYNVPRLRLQPQAANEGA